MILKPGGAVKVTTGAFTAANFVGQSDRRRDPARRRVEVSIPNEAAGDHFPLGVGLLERGRDRVHGVRPLREATLPPFEANLTADTGTHTLTIEMITNYSSWHWARWVLTGDLQ